MGQQRGDRGSGPGSRAEEVVLETGQPEEEVVALAELPESLADAAALAASRQRLLDRIGDTLASDLAGVMRGAIASLSALLAPIDAADDVATIRELAQSVAASDLSGILNDAGLDDRIEAFFARYQEVLDRTARDMRSLGLSPNILSTDMAFLQALADADDERWDLLGEDLAEVTRRAILGSVVGTTTMKSVAEAIQQALDTSIGQAVNISRTMVNSYHRIANVALGDAAGTEHFLYVGPSDGITRPFCRPLVNKVLRRDQIDGLQNGQIEPALTFGGGFNCRHHWAPVSAPDGGADDFPMASSKDLRRARAAGQRGRGGPSKPRS